MFKRVQYRDKKVQGSGTLYCNAPREGFESATGHNPHAGEPSALSSGALFVSDSVSISGDTESEIYSRRCRNGKSGKHEGKKWYIVFDILAKVVFINIFFGISS